MGGGEPLAQVALEAAAVLLTAGGIIASLWALERRQARTWLEQTFAPLRARWLAQPPPDTTYRMDDVVEEVTRWL